MAEAKRVRFKVVFGEGTESWSMGDPGHPMVVNAGYRARHGTQSGNDGAMLLASLVSDLHYLVHVCPSMKLACEKLAALRAAVRQLGPVGEE